MNVLLRFILTSFLYNQMTGIFSSNWLPHTTQYKHIPHMKCKTTFKIVHLKKCNIIQYQYPINSFKLHSYTHRSMRLLCLPSLHGDCEVDVTYPNSATKHGNKNSSCICWNFSSKLPYHFLFMVSELFDASCFWTKSLIVNLPSLYSLDCMIKWLFNYI